MPILDIRLLGDFSLTYGHTHQVILDSARLQSLLVYLLLHRRAPQPRQQLAFLLWPDTSERQAQTNLRNLLHRLRAALADIDQFLRIESKTLQWRNDATFRLDIAEFEDALRQAEQSADEIVSETARARAVELYMGDLLPKCYDEWMVGERDRLHALFLKALEALITLHENRRAYAPAIEYAQRLLRHEPLCELAYQRLIQLYALNGDRASALRTYHTCVTVFQRELAVEPDAATRQIYERLVNAEAALAAAHKPTPSLAALAPLVGRQQEWRQLKVLWRSAALGQAHFVVLAGEAGIGKTRLVEELLTWAERQGFRTAMARCYAAEGTLVYAPVVTWLRAEAVQKTLPRLDQVWLGELLRLLPELRIAHPALPPPSPLTEGWQRQHLFEAVARALLVSNQPLLLVIDDLQWCDQETLEWLHFLLRFADPIRTAPHRSVRTQQRPHAPLLIVGTRRTGELVMHKPLAALLATLRGSPQLTEMELSRLEATETIALATQLADRPLAAALATRLVQETEGNPLFIVEMVRAGLATRAGSQEQDKVERPPFVKHQPLPATIQRVIEARLNQLSSPARELVGLAAAIGREFTFGVLAAASASDENTLAQVLDELWQRQIVREQGSDAYDFTHGLLREVAYANLSAARRRLLHRRIAEGMAQVVAHDWEAASGQLAAHYELGGLQEQAVVWYQRAAATAQTIYSNNEAIQFYQRALALIGALANPTSQRIVYAQLQEGLGTLLLLTGQSEQATAAFEHALNGLPTEARIERAALHQKIGAAQQQNERALQAFTLAETVLGEPPAVPNPAWWQAWVEVQQARIGIYYWLNQQQAITDLIEKVQERVVEYGTNVQRARFHHALVLINWRRDRYRVSRETLALCQTALDISLASGNVNEIVLMRFSVGFNQLWYGDLDAAQDALQVTLALTERTGDVANQLACIIYLTITYRKRGQVEMARELALRSLACAETIQSLVYIGTASANLAWVAWRQGDLRASKQYAEAALAAWRHETAYPFQWTALWPLLAVAVAQEKLSAALAYARRLLEPAQQALPDELAAVVEDALRRSEQGDLATARSCLDQALHPAQALGYL